MQALDHDFNPNRLERYLAAAADGGVESVVLLTKADLATDAQREAMLERARQITSARVLALSRNDEAGLRLLREWLLPGRTWCLLGSSGVGKSTLANRLLGREALATAQVSGTGEGTHTTTRRQLLVLEGGALLVDTPGMRELGLAGDAAQADLGGIGTLSARCRFADCRHEGEPGCAVRAAVDSGELPDERLDNYRKLRKEAEFHALSALDKRRRDKAFGKMVKAVKQGGRG